MRQSSIVVRVSAVVVSIVLLTVVSLLASYWISDRAGDDAYAINFAGSLRYQSFRLGLLLSQPEPDPQQLEALTARIAQTWKKPTFTRLRNVSAEVDARYRTAFAFWQAIQPQLVAGNAEMPAQLDTLVRHLDELVTSIQHHAEANALLLQRVQIAALLLILLLSAIVVHWLRTGVAQPLAELTLVARRIGRGDFTYRTPSRRLDELGLLARALNRMSDAIATIQGRMEEQILHQTKALQRSNTTLQFLYDIANSIIEHPQGGIDYDSIVTRLARLVDAADIELCLMTDTGNRPYLQVRPGHTASDTCGAHRCESCLAGEFIEQPAPRPPLSQYSFPLLHDQRHYGVLACRVEAGEPLDTWRRQLIQSVADQLALALSLQAQEDNARRLSLAQERTVIARELHDSLAQTLSYLKIQVARLNRALERRDHPQLQNVSEELQVGLGTAYRQLRELLTTFRLKVDGPGLLSALETSVEQLRRQTTMKIGLDYRLANLPLTPNEEVHLLQMIREAAQNAIHHSGGRELLIHIYEVDNGEVRLSVEDDGIGIDESPEKLNHYGLAIMAERGRNLGGEIAIRRREAGGTGVYFHFTPACRRQQPVIARQG